MHHIIYWSQANKPMMLKDLMPILMQARVLNEQRNITGALVYGDGRFLQVTEGEQKPITTLYQRIYKDPRHQLVCKLVDKAIERRSFVHWAMAFDEVSADQFSELFGCMSSAQLALPVVVSSAAEKLLINKMREIVCIYCQKPCSGLADTDNTQRQPS